VHNIQRLSVHSSHEKDMQTLQSGPRPARDSPLGVGRNVHEYRYSG